MISIIGLTKYFGKDCIINDLNMELPESGIISVCGPSGCGKSTLLGILAGIDRDFSGNLTGLPAHDMISMSFQEPSLLPRRTAAENVNLVLGDRKSTLPEAYSLLSELGITEYLKYPGEMSGGMQARTGVARALVKKASLYLLDEPFASLDAETSLLVSGVIRRRTAGALVIAVVHNKELAAAFSDTVISFDGKPMSHYSVQATERTGAYIT